MEGDPGPGTPTGQLTESGLLSTNCPLILLTLAINFTGHPRGVFVSRFLMVPEKIVVSLHLQSSPSHPCPSLFGVLMTTTNVDLWKLNKEKSNTSCLFLLFDYTVEVLGGVNDGKIQQQKTKPNKMQQQ